MRLVDRGLDRRRHLRLEPGEFGEQHVGAEQEVAGIPQIAVTQVARGGGGVGLFDEALDRMHAVAADRRRPAGCSRSWSSARSA